MRAFTISPRFVLVALVLMLGASPPGFAQPPVKMLTAEQKERLEEIRRFSMESSALEKSGKLPEAIAAAEKMLALERSLFGAVHEDVVGSLKRLARMQESLEHFAVAQKERREVLALQTKLHGDKAWQVTDARLELQHVETLSRLDVKARQELKEADQWMTKAISNNKPGKYQEGAEFAEKALAIRLRLLGDENHQSAFSADWARFFWERANQLDKARAKNEQTLAIFKKVFGELHPDTANSLNDMGALLFREGDYAAARPYFEQALTIRKSVLGKGNSLTSQSYSSLIDVLRRLARTREGQEDFVSATKMSQRVLTLLTEQFSDKAWQVIDARLDLQHVETLSRLDVKARQELKEADQWMTKAISNNKPGKYQEGAEFAEKALAIRLRLLGDENRRSGWSAGLTGILWEKASEYKKAGPFSEQALAIDRKVLGDHHPDTAFSLNNLGSLLQSQGDYAAARPYYEQALAIRKKILGNNHPDTATSLNNLGSLLQSQGDYAAARSYYEQALAIQKKALGENHANTATSLNNLGGLLSTQGDYAAARPYYEQALAIRNKIFGTNHPHAAQSLNNLGGLLSKQGDSAAARRYFEQALAIFKKTLGDYHPETANSLNNLGFLLRNQGDYAAARPYLEQALAIFKKVVGENHPDTANSLNNLGMLLQSQGDYAAARSYYEQALAIYKKVLGEHHPDTANSLNNLGMLLQSQGDYVAARPYYEQALAISKKMLGDQHSTTAIFLNNLGALLHHEGDDAAARPYFEQALAISRSSLDLAAAAQSERQQLLMGASLRHQFSNYLSLPSHTDVKTVDTYAHVLAWKGSVLARQQRLRLERQSPQLAPLVAELRTVSSQLAALAFAIPAPKQRDAWNRQLVQLTANKEALERELAQKSQSFLQDQELKDLTPSKLLEILPTDTALVDFLVYRHGHADQNKQGKWSYSDRLTAFVLKQGATIVRLDLGPMAPIEKAIDQWRHSYKKQPGKAHPGVELRRRLWLPLEKHLAGAKTIIISPDDALGRLPFAALPGGKEGSYLLEDVALSVVPVPRLLPTLLGKDRYGSGKEPSLLLVGDVDFDTAIGKSDAGTRVAATGTLNGNRRAWNRLPGSKGEILVIRDAFEQRFADAKVKILRGEQATQARVRELASQYSHLHLATHGFFAPPEVRSALAGDDKNPSADDLFDQQGVTGFHPGLLSGLVFAGANKPPAPGQSDGILTALEVAELDLTKVELAVLSACETGLGKVAAGEGILGLQRAFQVAGARSVVASLWSVDDEATRKLMERFYDNHWQKKMSKADALRQAQLAMLRGELVRGLVLEDPDEPRRVPPYYWAAFVLSGDWR